MENTENHNLKNLPAVIETATPVKFVPHPTNTAWLNPDGVTQKTFNNLLRRNQKTNDQGKLVDIYA